MLSTEQSSGPGITGIYMPPTVPELPDSPPGPASLGWLAWRGLEIHTTQHELFDCKCLAQIYPTGTLLFFELNSLAWFQVPLDGIGFLHSQLRTPIWTVGTGRVYDADGGDPSDERDGYVRRSGGVWYQGYGGTAARQRKNWSRSICAKSGKRSRGSGSCRPEAIMQVEGLLFTRYAGHWNQGGAGDGS